MRRLIERRARLIEGEMIRRLGNLNRLAAIRQLVDAHLREPRFLLLVVGGFAVVAVLLACVGVAGVMARTVVERRHEIGVRMALGASPSATRRQLLGEATRLSLWGLAAGTTVALAATRLLAGFLYGVSARSPTVPPR